MSFQSENLTYKAYTYKTNGSPITIKDQTIKLVKKGTGYGVPSKNILVKVHAAALNPVDLMLYNSAYTPIAWAVGEAGFGKDYSGTVADIGEEAAAKTGFKVGDEIAGLFWHPFCKGTLSEYIVLDPSSTADSSLIKKPTNLTLTEAASFPLVYGTAFCMMKNHDLKGKKVLVFGGSTSVGKYIIQLAKLKGAKIIVTTNSPKSDELVTRLGSTDQIDYTKNKNLLGPISESVKESGQFDYIYDTCGNSDLFPKISSIIKPRSTGSAYVTCVGDAKFNYSNVSMLSAVSMNMGSSVRGIKSKLGLGLNYTSLLISPSKEWIVEAKEYFEQGKLEIFIDSVYKFDKFNDAVDLIKTNKANGKVIVEVEA